MAAQVALKRDTEDEHVLISPSRCMPMFTQTTPDRFTMTAREDSVSPNSDEGKPVFSCILYLIFNVSTLKSFMYTQQFVNVCEKHAVYYNVEHYQFAKITGDTFANLPVGRTLGGEDAESISIFVINFDKLLY